MTRAGTAEVALAEATAKPRPTRAGMTIATRAALIDIARRHFGECGYADISLEQVTAEARLTRGALYHHFASKQGLFRAVVDDIDEEIDRMFQARMAARATPGEDFWESIRIACHCYLEMIQQENIRQIVLRDAPNHYPDFGQRLARLHCHRQTVEALQALHRQGRFAMSDAEAAAYLIEGATTGLVNWAVETASSLSDSRAKFDEFLDGLAQN